MRNKINNVGSYWLSIAPMAAFSHTARSGAPVVQLGCDRASIESRGMAGSK